jgi:hypothetical protein
MEGGQANPRARYVRADGGGEASGGWEVASWPTLVAIVLSLALGLAGTITGSWAVHRVLTDDANERACAYSTQDWPNIKGDWVALSKYELQSPSIDCYYNDTCELPVVRALAGGSMRISSTGQFFQMFKTLPCDSNDTQACVNGYETNPDVPYTCMGYKTGWKVYPEALCVEPTDYGTTIVQVQCDNGEEKLVTSYFETGPSNGNHYQWAEVNQVVYKRVDASA